jgi:hypothetical protein
MELEDMISPNLAMDNWEAASDQGGNLLMQNACLDHFRDGLSDGRTPQPINQLTINHFIINP